MQLSLQNLIDLYQKTLPAMLNDQQRIEIITWPQGVALMA